MKKMFMSKLTAALLLTVVLALGLTVLPLLANGLSIVAPFDPLAGELPEALAVDDDGDIFVGMAPTGEVKKVTPDGDQDFFAQLPSPAGGFMTGMKLGEDDMLYVGLASFNVDTGIYRVGPEGGAAELFASLPEMSVPNGLEFDEGGNLYVSNTNFGRIWKIGPDGNATIWSDDALLMGMVLPGPLPFPLGPNGIAFDEDGENLFVAITSEGRLVRIPVQEDGSASPAEVFVPNNPLLVGADGVTFGEDGTLYVAIVLQDQVAAVSADGDVALVAGAGLLQNPSDLAFGDDDETLYITNFALIRVVEPDADDPPAPALLALAVEDEDDEDEDGEDDDDD